MSDGGGGGRRWVRLAIRAVGPVLVIAVIYKLGDPEQLLSLIGAAALLPVLGACLLNFGAAQFKVMRWLAFIAARDKRYNMGRAWSAYLAAGYLGTVTPGRVGDVLRVQYMRHDIDMPYSEGLAIIVNDRFCDLYVLAAAASIGVARFAEPLGGELGKLAWGAVALAILAPMVFLIPGITDGVTLAVYKRVSKEGSTEGAARFLKTLRSLFGRTLVVTVPLTACAYAVNYTQAWIVARALGIDITWFDVMCILSITSLLGLLPISVSGVGLREAFCAGVFPLLGATAAQGVAFGLLVLAVLYVFWIVVGFIAWQIAPPPIGAGEAHDNDDTPE